MVSARESCEEPEREVRESLYRTRLHDSARYPGLCGEADGGMGGDLHGPSDGRAAGRGPRGSLGVTSERGH